MNNQRPLPQGVQVPLIGTQDDRSAAIYAQIMSTLVPIVTAGTFQRHSDEDPWRPRDIVTFANDIAVESMRRLRIPAPAAPEEKPEIAKE